MAYRKKTEESPVTDDSPNVSPSVETLKEDLIAFGREYIEKIKSKQVQDTDKAIEKVIEIYNSVK